MLTVMAVPLPAQLSKAGREHEPLLGHLMWVAAHVAKQEGLSQVRCAVLRGRAAQCMFRWGRRTVLKRHGEVAKG